MEEKKGPVFVNAATRTPDHDGIVHLKIGQLNRVGNFFDNASGKGVYIQGYEPWTLGEEKFDGVFWLDESGTIAGREEDAVSFAEWLYKNRWFSFENGKWYYTFEQGASVSEKTYQKNYVKATAQLYELFKSQNSK